MAIDTNALVLAAMIFYIVAGTLFLLTAGWVLYVKADRPGWASLIPIYNTYVLLQIVGRPGWWLVLYFIPVVGNIIIIVNIFDLAKAFGQGILFGLGLLFLGPIFVPILAFGEAEYVGDGGGDWAGVG